MNTFTVVATGQATASPAEVEAAVRAALVSVGMSLIPCDWAPDLDTVADAADVPYGSIHLVDLN